MPSSPVTVRQSRSVSLTTSIAITVIVAVVAFTGGMRLQYWAPTWLIGNNGNPQFSQLQNTFDILKSKFAEGPVDTSKAFDGAQHGLVASLGDPYTVYFTADEARAFNDSLNGTFSGIGAELAIQNSQLIIQSVIDGSPAMKAGVQAGDAIKKVNGQDTTGWSVEKAASTIRGNKGTTVKLSLQRGTSVADYSVMRDTITNPSVRYSIDSNNIGYMQINRFAQDDTSSISAKAADYFKSKNVKGVILDLRGNGGGYVSAAQDVASLWLGSGKTVVTERKGNTVMDTLKTNGDAVLQGIPTVVLIDGNTASASEIVAGALHDYKAATLVGTQSFGKGSVQEVVNLAGGAELKVTVALWYTPDGNNINKQGIAPDSTVTISQQDITTGNDPQKAKATEILNK